MYARQALVLDMELSQILTLAVAVLGITISNAIVVYMEGRRITREDHFRWNSHRQEAYVKVIGALELLEFHSDLQRRSDLPVMSDVDFSQVYDSLNQATNTVAIVSNKDVVTKTKELQDALLRFLTTKGESGGAASREEHLLHLEKKALEVKNAWINTVRKDLGLCELDQKTLQKVTGGAAQKTE
ncbi:hypothetical protein [Saccharopolyspora griseoalba]|uniref:Uncharacterized protein n=1 Tax=Saccharopolyspora griseoalba TaxID=1431848 RepID=A0ABW2LLU6_9PSEU